MKKLLLVVVAFLIVSTMDYNDEVLAQSNYCEMVDIFNESNGEHGWPDYNKTYETECKQ